jgi:hypothetical protein
MLHGGEERVAPDRLRGSRDPDRVEAELPQNDLALFGHHEQGEA